MKDYLLLFRGGLNIAAAAPEQIQEAMMKWKNWMTELANKGLFNGAERLNRNGAVITGSKKQITDGPYTETKEIVGGYMSIKAENLNEAIELAKGCPIFNYDGIVEVREVIKM